MAKNVLIVDDSFVMRALLREIVSADPDLSVIGEAGNGLEALQKMRASNIDVVLMDIEMPQMDGLETLKRLRLVSQVPVIIISSVAQVGSPQAMEARRLGAADIIPKPSGAMSLDLKAKKGHDIVKAIRRVTGI